MKAALCGALYPNILVMEETVNQHVRPGWLDEAAEVALHPASLAHPLLAYQFVTPYVMGLEKARTLSDRNSIPLARICHNRDLSGE